MISGLSLFARIIKQHPSSSPVFILKNLKFSTFKEEDCTHNIALICITFNYNKYYKMSYISSSSVSKVSIPDSVEIPAHFICPITGDLMRNAVMGPDGHSYDEEAIRQWLTKNPTSPKTRQPMYLEQLIPNRQLREGISSFILSYMTGYTEVPEPSVLKTEPSTTSSAITSYKPSFSCKSWTIDTTRYVDVRVGIEGTIVPPPIYFTFLLDKSGSMITTNEVTTADGSINISMFWLAIHCAKCIAHIGGSNVFLAIHTFGSEVRQVVPFTKLTEAGIREIDRRLQIILEEGPTGSTNMFQAIKSVKPPPEGGRSVTILLTDGQPDPVSGYTSLVQAVQDLHSVGKGIPSLNGTLHTIAFGNNVDSRVLQDIAGLSKGGRFFHAPSQNEIGPLVANLVASELITLHSGINFTCTMMDGSSKTITTYPIRNGQPCHMILKDVKYISCSDKPIDIEETTNPFLQFRQKIIATLVKGLDMYERSWSNSVRKNSFCGDIEGLLKELHSEYKSSTNTRIKNVLLDIISLDPNQGQLVLATQYMNTWGEPYLRAYLDGLYNCIPFNNMDPGLLGFIGEPMEKQRKACQIAMLDVEPFSITSTMTYYEDSRPHSIAHTMAALSTVMTGSGSCFAPGTLVQVPSGTKAIEDLKRGDVVKSAKGFAIVLYVLEATSAIRMQRMCQLSKNLLITEYHPVLDPIKGEWNYPNRIVDATEMDMPTVYNLVLDSGHTVIVDDIVCCTLAHGFRGPIIEHEFFGTDRVIEAMSRQPGFKEGRPVYKDIRALRQGSETGLIVGWVENA